MRIKDGVVMSGLDVVMRQVLVSAEAIWLQFGREEGVTVTSALDGCHSAGSYHYYGLALDFRTGYFSEDEKKAVFRALCLDLDLTMFDVVLEKDHIHVEYDLVKNSQRG